MLRDLENNDTLGFKKVSGSLSPEESRTLQKMTFAEIGQTLGMSEEM